MNIAEQTMSDTASSGSSASSRGTKRSRDECKLECDEPCCGRNVRPKVWVPNFWTDMRDASELPPYVDSPVQSSMQPPMQQPMQPPMQPQMEVLQLEQQVEEEQVEEEQQVVPPQVEEPQVVEEQQVVPPQVQLSLWMVFSLIVEMIQASNSFLWIVNPEGQMPNGEQKYVVMLKVDGFEMQVEDEFHNLRFEFREGLLESNKRRFFYAFLTAFINNKLVDMGLLPIHQNSAWMFVDSNQNPILSGLTQSQYYAYFNFVSLCASFYDQFDPTTIDPNRVLYLG